MSSGLRFSNSGASPEQMSRSFVPGQVDHRLGYVAPIDAFAFSVSRDAEFPPNTVGRYRNSDPWTLGYIVRRTVEDELGEEYLTWPQRFLFDEVGIRRFTLETDPYSNFLLTEASKYYVKFSLLFSSSTSVTASNSNSSSSRYAKLLFHCFD